MIVCAYQTLKDKKENENFSRQSFRLNDIKWIGQTFKPFVFIDN